MRLTGKVFLALAVVITVAIVTFSVAISRTTGVAYRGYLTDVQQESLQRIAGGAADLYLQTGDWTVAQAWLDTSAMPMMVGGQMVGGQGMPGSRRWRNGAVERDDDHMAVASLLLVHPTQGTALAGGTAGAVDGAMLRLAAPVEVNGQVVARLVRVDAQTVAFGVAEVAFLSRLTRAVVLAAGAAALFALGVGGVLVYGILKPLRQLDEGVARVAAGDLSARVALGSRDEIGQLAARFNRMAASLEQQEALRQRLVADIAHELRTPLSVVQGNLQALLDGVYPLQAAEIQTIYDETRVLSRLVNDLHELAQAEAGRLPLSPQPLEVQEVTRHMAALFQPLAQQRGVALSAQATGGLRVQADPDRIQQVLHNLLTNGLRHTPGGGRVALTAEGRGAHVRFTVQDTGSGIPADALPHVFDRFYQVDASRTPAANGTSGLGLAIVKALVEAHGGRVGAESAVGIGSAFWFELPATP